MREAHTIKALRREVGHDTKFLKLAQFGEYPDHQIPGGCGYEHFWEIPNVFYVTVTLSREKATKALETINNHWKTQEFPAIDIHFTDGHKEIAPIIGCTIKPKELTPEEVLMEVYIVLNRDMISDSNIDYGPPLVGQRWG